MRTQLFLCASNYTLCECARSPIAGQRNCGLTWWTCAHNYFYAQATIPCASAHATIPRASASSSCVRVASVDIFASVSPPWISLNYSVSSFIFLKLHAMFLKKFIASTCPSLTRKLFSTPRACRKPDVGVVRTTTNRRPSLLSCFELMSSNLPNNKANAADKQQAKMTKYLVVNP